MTVKIGEMKTTFSNANVVYVAIGMEVTDNASANTSKLINLSVNEESKFQVTKDGTLKINTDFPPNSKFPILSIDNNSSNVMVVVPNNIIFSQNTVIEKDAFVKSYSEGIEIINASGPNLDHVTINLANASVFFIKTSYGTLRQLTLAKPNVMVKSSIADGRAYSCSLVIDKGITINTAFWTSANVKFGSNVYTRSSSNNYSVYTLMNFDIKSESSLSNTWFGIVSGENFAL